MNEIMEKISVENMIYEIGGVEVMLDSDLAKLYQVETKRINEAVRNNPLKFPERFSWKLNDKESKNFLVENFDQKIETRGGKYKNPRVFTEQGVAMLATILRSKIATEVSIAIMDAFVKMRHYINYNKNVLPHKFMLLEDKVNDNTKRINELFDKFNPKDIAKNSIFFENTFYDSYSLLINILKQAKEEIIIIDNYASKELLDILKQVNTNITVVSKNIDNILKKKYIKQYSNITFINNDLFHDRFIIIDRKILYNSGASFKDIGKKCFCINEIKEKDIIEEIIDKIFNKKGR